MGYFHTKNVASTSGGVFLCVPCVKVKMLRLNVASLCEHARLLWCESGFKQIQDCGLFGQHCMDIVEEAAADHVLRQPGPGTRDGGHVDRSGTHRLQSCHGGPHLPYPGTVATNANNTPRWVGYPTGG